MDYSYKYGTKRESAEDAEKVMNLAIEMARLGRTAPRTLIGGEATDLMMTLVISLSKRGSAILRRANNLSRGNIGNEEGSWKAWRVLPASMTDEEAIEASGFERYGCNYPYSPSGRPFSHGPWVSARSPFKVLVRASGGLDI